MARMKFLGYFHQRTGGVCKKCNEHFTTDEQRIALAHFEHKHHWECLHAGTESEDRDSGIFNRTVYHYGKR
jgi:hypothetical protein